MEGEIGKRDHLPTVGQKKDLDINKKLELEHQLNSGSNWFYFIALVSLLNSIIILSGQDWILIAGLGVTQIIHLVIGSGIALIVDIILAGVLVIFGILAKKKIIGALFWE